MFDFAGITEFVSDLGPHCCRPRERPVFRLRPPETTEELLSGVVSFVRHVRKAFPYGLTSWARYSYRASDGFMKIHANAWLQILSASWSKGRAR